MRKTGFPEIRAFVTLSPSANSQMDDATSDPTDAPLVALENCQSGGLFALREVVSKSLEIIPECKEIRIRLRLQHDLTRSSVKITSSGEVCCSLPWLKPISVGLRNVEQGAPIPVKIRVNLWGTPSKASELTALQELQRMNEILAAQLTTCAEGLIFQDVAEFKHDVLEIIQRARDALAEYISVTRWSIDAQFFDVRTLVASSDQDAEIFDHPQDDEDLQPDQGHETSMDYLEERAPLPISSSNEGPQEGYTHTMSTISHSDEHSTALRELLQQLDLQLMFIESPAAALQQLMEDLDSRLAAAISTPSNQVKATDENLRLSEVNPPVQARRPMERGVVIALGSNVGNKIEEIEKACRAIDEDPDMRIVDTSFLYETKPMYVEDQDTFVNGACEVSPAVMSRQTIHEVC